MIQFGLRGCNEHKELRWRDVTLKTDSEGKKDLEYFERQTKTRTGEEPRNQRPIKPRMYANKANAISADRNPVHVYKVYTNCTKCTNSLNSFKNTIRKKNLEALLEEGCHNCPLCSN